MTGYFNSIRELGGTQTQVVDDIQSRYQYLKNKKFVEKLLDSDDKRVSASTVFLLLTSLTAILLFDIVFAIVKFSSKQYSPSELVVENSSEKPSRVYGLNSNAKKGKITKIICKNPHGHSHTRLHQSNGVFPIINYIPFFIN